MGKNFKRSETQAKPNPVLDHMWVYNGEKVIDPNFNRKNILESLNLMHRGRSAEYLFTLLYENIIKLPIGPLMI